MNSYLLSLIFTISIFISTFAQYRLPVVDSETLFLMEIDGSNLNNKVNWDDFNNFGWVREFYQEFNFKDWNDFTATGIDYSKKQYQYYKQNDSIYSYVLQMPIKDIKQLETFIKTSQLNGVEVENHNTYKSAPLDNNSILAWDDYNIMIVFAFKVFSWSTDDVAIEATVEAIGSDDYIQEGAVEAEVNSAEPPKMALPSDVQMYKPKETEEEKKQRELEENLEQVEEEIYYLNHEKEYYVSELDEFEKLKTEYNEELERINEEIANLEDIKDHLNEYGRMPYLPEDEEAYLEKPLQEENGVYDEVEVAEHSVKIPDSSAKSLSQEEYEDEAIAVPLPYNENDAQIDKPYDEYYDDNYIGEATDNSSIGLYESKRFRMLNSYAQAEFKRYFNSNVKQLPDSIMHYKNAKSDIYAWADFNVKNSNTSFDDMYFLGPYYNILNFYMDYISGISATSYYSNVFFKEEEVLVEMKQYYKNDVTRKEIQKMYTQKFDKKLLPFLDDKNLINYSLKFNSEAYLNGIYNILYPSNVNSKDIKNYKKTEAIKLFISTVKIFLDEKAISELATGNGVFALHSLEEKDQTYIDYIYDEDYNVSEIEKTKKVLFPNFSAAFITKNDAYWNRFLFVMANSFENNVDYNNGIYSVKLDDDEIFNELHFVIKNDIVLISSSLEGINRLKNTNRATASKNLKNKVKNNSMYLEVNSKDFIRVFKEEMGDSQGLNSNPYFELLTSEVGDIAIESNFKDDTLNYELHYKTYKEGTNSLMYFLNLMEEIYKIDAMPYDENAVY